VWVRIRHDDPPRTHADESHGSTLRPRIGLPHAVIIHRAGLTCNSCRPQLAQLRSDPDAQGLTRLGDVCVLHKRLDRRGGRRRMPPRVRCTRTSCSRSVGSVKRQRGRNGVLQHAAAVQRATHLALPNVQRPRCNRRHKHSARCSESHLDDAPCGVQHASRRRRRCRLWSTCMRASGPAAWSAALRC
jgi:hypothetical protein